MVGEGGYSKRISLNKNPNVNKKMGGDAGVGRVRWGLRKFFYMNPNLKQFLASGRGGGGIWLG